MTEEITDTAGADVTSPAPKRIKPRDEFKAIVAKYREYCKTPEQYSEQIEWFNRWVSSLTPREERILRMHYGIDMSSKHTLEEIGQQFGVTRERIRQIEAKALHRLKHPARFKKFSSFFNL